uniref:Uncharacterized protein n=1 Tax=Neogobius melanostomus TaxID=47308 RepID=A0A8C6UQF6_9GOBI
MASVSCEDQFLCSICLGIFTDPVTTACGHSFCNICINQYWDKCKPCRCPMCKEKFRSRPTLKTSTFMSEMVSEFKKKRKRDDAEPQTSESNRKVKKRKKPQRPISTVENKEERTCPKHAQPFMELFCKDHSQLICAVCFSDHKTHNIVPLKEQCEEEQSELQQKIKERRQKIQELQRSVELSQENSDRDMKEGVEFFNDLIKCVQQSLDQFKQSIEQTHEEAKQQAGEFIRKLKSEISALEQRQAQMKKILSSSNQFHVVQSFTLYKPTLEQNDWADASLKVPSCGWRMCKAVAELQNTILIPKIKGFFNGVLKQVKQHAVDVTLDPDTASPCLVVSKDHKQVHYIDDRQNLPDTPERFSDPLYVVGKQKFSSGKFYFEVQVKEKPGWCLGVVKESIDRKGNSQRTSQNGYWKLIGGINLHNLWSVPQKVGVFVNYEEGMICFIDAETSAVIHMYTDCCFTEPLLPLLNPCTNPCGINGAPLIITPVNV